MMGMPPRGGTATTKGPIDTMSYATDMLRDEVQDLSGRLTAGKISDRDHERLTDLVEFFSLSVYPMPCGAVRGCKDEGVHYKELNDDDGVWVCNYHEWGHDQGDFIDDRIAAPGEALHARTMRLHDADEGTMTDYGLVLGYYTGTGFTHWVATLDFPKWTDIYADGRYHGDEDREDRFGRLRFWELGDNNIWELRRWAHQADLLPWNATAKGEFDTDAARYGYNPHPLDTPILPAHADDDRSGRNEI